MALKNSKCFLAKVKTQQNDIPQPFNFKKRESKKETAYHSPVDRLSVWWKRIAHCWASKGHQTESFLLPLCLFNMALQAQSIEVTAMVFYSGTPLFLLSLSLISLFRKFQTRVISDQQFSSVGLSKASIWNNCFKQSLLTLKHLNFNKSSSSTKKKNQLNSIIVFFLSLCSQVPA